MVHAWNPSDSEGWGRRIMFEANLDDFVRPCLKINSKDWVYSPVPSGRKRIKEEPGTVVHSYNPNNLGSWGRRIESSLPAWQLSQSCMKKEVFQRVLGMLLSGKAPQNKCLRCSPNSCFLRKSFCFTQNLLTMYSPTSSVINRSTFTFPNTIIYGRD